MAIESTLPKHLTRSSWRLALIGFFLFVAVFIAAGVWLGFQFPLPPPHTSHITAVHNLPQVDRLPILVKPLA